MPSEWIYMTSVLFLKEKKDEETKRKSQATRKGFV